MHSGRIRTINHDKLITATGEINDVYVRYAARVECHHRYGALGKCNIIFCEENWRSRAEIMARRFERANAQQVKIGRAA